MGKNFDVLMYWGPTLSTAIISVLSSLHLNHRSISADVKAKSRIKWIEEVRDVTVSFISSCDDLINYVNFRPYNDATPDEKMEYENLMKKTIKYANELKLFFPDNRSDCDDQEDHSEIIRDMKQSKSNRGMDVKMIYLFDEMSKISSEVLSQLDCYERADIQEHFKKLPSSYSEDISYAVSRYLKIEWDRAKEGK
jgi:hypothetical protein